MTENTANKQGNGFKKGQSGNPNGRPKGALNRTTLACQTLLDSEAENITRQAVTLALGGDMTAIKLCLERIIPARKERLIKINLPVIEDGETDLHKFSAELLKAVTDGQITITEAQGLLNLATVHEKALGKDLFRSMGFEE